jgi:hypothetical protein
MTPEATWKGGRERWKGGWEGRREGGKEGGREGGRYHARQWNVIAAESKGEDRQGSLCVDRAPRKAHAGPEGGREGGREGERNK